jgi:hypothetical protein
LVRSRQTAEPNIAEAGGIDREKLAMKNVDSNCAEDIADQSAQP